MRKQCRCKLTCGKCNRNHPTILHDSKPPQKQETTGDNKATCGSTGAGEDEYSLKVVPVLVRSKNNGKTMMTYALLDDGSDAVFCSERLQKQLHVRGQQTDLHVKTLTGQQRIKSSIVSGLQVADLDGQNWLDLPAAYTQDKIPASLEDAITNADIKKWAYLDEVALHEVDDSTLHVSLLIGSNVPAVMEPLQVINSKGNGPFAYKTRVGWVVCGVNKRKGSKKRPATVNRIMTNEILENQIIQQLTHMYNQDFTERLIHDKPERSQEDQMFMDIMTSSITKANGQYQLPLPLRNSDVEFPDNKPMAEQRLAHLKRKFVRNQTFKEQYVDSMESTIELGYAEAVPVSDHDSTKTWYIPHHGVYHPQKKKLRVVFDCAARYRGVSLNDELIKGPDLTSSLVGVLLRFRRDFVAVIADIEAMFHQVKVPRADRDLLRFLWWPEGDVNKPAKAYRMTSHLFGAKSSPSCANYALQALADETEGEASDVIRENFYVDDLLCSTSTTENAVVLVQQLKDTCNKGGFNLTKWMSNSKEVLSSIPQHDRAKEAKPLDLSIDSLPVERALGVLWNAATDSFKFNINLLQKPPTRRGILSMVSAVYDPLGFIAPCTLTAKILMQDLCRLKLSWDEDIPSDHLIRWQKWMKDITKLSELTIPRCFKPTGFEPTSYELHHFSDASEVGYGTVSYLRFRNDRGDVHCSMVMAKARVAPLKKISIPRMEPTAATVSVRVNHMIQEELKLPIEHVYFWTDSKTVLNYISNNTARFHTFVANRLALIHDGTKVSQWRYVPTDLNPADDCSRGMSVTSFLESQRWIQGPDFLYRTESEWPTVDLDPQGLNYSSDPEVKKRHVSMNAVKSCEGPPDIKVPGNEVETDQSTSPLDELIEHYSSWYRLKRAVAWLVKLKCNLYARLVGDQSVNINQAKKMTPSLSRDDLHDAEKIIIQHVQQSAFAEEIKALRRGQHLKKSSSLLRLDPKLDGDNILRVGGRLRKSALPSEQKHPCILPKHHRVTKLILEGIHKGYGHMGRSFMLSQFRQRFWAPGANSTCRAIVNQCVDCRRQHGKVQGQKMADLPTQRVLPDDPPFSRVGMDFFGPFEVKRGRSMLKRYGVVFTCMAIRAVHIEVSDSLDTDSCINAIRRFVARRGQVREIQSDNGTNLVGANKEMKTAIKTWNQAQIHEVLLQKGIKWTFNPPAASHFGGVWERQIRTIRKVMLSIMKEQTLTDESLTTLFCEIEAIINSRPITTVSTDANDLEALTPNHLLLMNKKPNLPPTLTDPKDQYARRRWRQVQYLADIFWRRWTKEYLPLLQERQKWNRQRENLKVGDIVLLVDNTAPRNNWIMGRVVETQPDRYGRVRSVQLKTNTGVYTRPVCKLVKMLECDEPDLKSQ